MSQGQNYVDTERLHEDNPVPSIIAGIGHDHACSNHNIESVKSGDEINANAQYVFAIEDLTNLFADHEFQHASSTHRRPLMPQRFDSQACPTSIAALAEPLACETCDTGRALATRDLVCRDFRDALGSFADRLARRASVAVPGKASGATLSAHLDVANGYGVRFATYEVEGRMQVC